MNENTVIESSRIENLQELYIRCMNCTNTSVSCPGIWKDIQNGVPPRGFYFEYAPIKILAVAKNPGHPFDDEKPKFAGKNGRDLYQAHQHLHTDASSIPESLKNPSLRFRYNLLRYLSKFLDVPVSEVYKYAAHTNLVKCSTTKEQGSLHPQTMEECYNKFLAEEVKLFQPEVLLAFGREVEYFLLRKSWKLGIPVVYIKHPSYFYRKDQEEQILCEIKTEISYYLKQ